MVAIFTGLGSGLERGSGSVLGGSGLLGSATLGRAGENLFLNAATGNLVINNQDEFLVGMGPDASVSRTYNSLGNFSDENADNWRQSTDRNVYGFTGTLNQAGSSLHRVGADGADMLIAGTQPGMVTSELMSAPMVAAPTTLWRMTVSIGCGPTATAR